MIVEIVNKLKLVYDKVWLSEHYALVRIQNTYYVLNKELEILETCKESDGPDIQSMETPEFIITIDGTRLIEVIK